MGIQVVYELSKPHPFTGREPQFGYASFLCPVCMKPLYGGGRASTDPCLHVLLTFNSSGAIRCRDVGVQALVEDAQEAVQFSGADPMEALRGQLDSNVVFFELLDQSPGSTEVEVVTFVIDLAASRESTQTLQPH
jgi:hypothetical protein